jgi:hypothetical protein
VFFPRHLKSRTRRTGAPFQNNIRLNLLVDAIALLPELEERFMLPRLFTLKFN